MDSEVEVMQAGDGHSTGDYDRRGGMFGYGLEFGRLICGCVSLLPMVRLRSMGQSSLVHTVPGGSCIITVVYIADL